MGHREYTDLQPDSETRPLVVKGHLFNEDLTFDLYGEWTRQGGSIVETVKIAGTDHNVTSILSGKQLSDLGSYLDFRNDLSPSGKQMANTYRSQSTHY